MRRTCVALVAAAPIGVGLLAMGGAPAAAATPATAPVWTCRASALYASIAGQNRVEPIVANGNPNTANGVNPNFPFCATANVGEGNLPTPLGIPTSFLKASTATATTVASPAQAPAIEQAIGADAHIEGLSLGLGATVVPLSIGAADANITGSCVNGVPTLKGTSYVTNIDLGGTTISLDNLLTALSNALKPLNELVSIGVNTQTTDPATGELTVDALEISIINATNKAPLVDIVVAQAQAGYNGMVCNPSAYPPGTLTSISPSSLTPAQLAALGNGTIEISGPHTLSQTIPTCGKITLHWVRTGRKSLSTLFGIRNVIRGKIVTCGAHPRPIVNARVDLTEIIKDGRHLMKTGLKSRPGGKLTLITPDNLTSRSLVFDYRPSFASSHISSTYTLHLTVRTKSGKIVNS